MHLADTPKQSDLQRSQQADTFAVAEIKAVASWLLDGLPNHRFTLPTYMIKTLEKNVGLSVTVNINHEHAYM